MELLLLMLSLMAIFFFSGVHLGWKWRGEHEDERKEEEKK